MKANISRWIILLLALICVVQVASASFDIKTETIYPASGALEPGQQVTARYVLSYSMITPDDASDEAFEFSTGLQSPTWDFIVYRDGVNIYKTTKTGYYPTLTEFEVSYGNDRTELDVQLRGTVPESMTGKVEVIKVQHVRDKAVIDTYSKVRDVVSMQQVTGSLSAQQQRLTDLKADIDDKAGRGVDVSPARAKYDAASQALTSAASAGPSQAAGYIATATKAIDEGKSLLDRAWAEKEISNTAATLETLDGLITYFVEDRSMGGDSQVFAIMAKRESAVQFYSQAKDNLNANNYPLARSKAIDGQNKANEALTDANALREKASSGSLDISSTPSGASIYIDGTYKGITPGVVSGLSAGSHQVRMLRSGYDDYTLITTVTAGKTTTVSAILTPISTSIPPPAYPTSGDVASVALAEGSLSVQQQRLTDLKADIDDKAGKGVDVSPAQAKYDAASQALANAASAGPSQAAEYIATATKVIDEGKSLLDRAWAEKEVSNAAATLETLNGLITYFVEDRSMGSDPQVVAIMTKRESAIQFYSQAKDNLNANNYPLARSKAIDGQNKANEALTDANALREKGDSGSNAGSNMLPYIGVMIVVVLSAGYFIYSRRSPGGRKGGDRTGGIRSPASPPDHGGGQASRRQKTVLPSREKPTDLSGVDVLGGKNERSLPYAVASERKSSGPVIKPEIAVTPSHTSIHADEWDKIGLTLANTGTAQAFDITLTFPNDIDTRLLRPVDLAAGESITLDVGIKPGAKGKVPLEIIVRYRDAGNQTYKQTASFWLSVEPRGDSVPSGSPVPSSIPRPVTPKSLPPEMAERYTASEYLGKGGFARVFKVQKPDGSWTALKIPISLDAATGKSFIAELHNWTSMVHENIVRVNDYNIMPFPYFEMELCDGTLAALEHPVPPDRAAWLIFNIGEGLKYTHARGILHRDLKPQNIMLRDGVPKISDWGLSKVMTQSGTTTVSGGFTAYYAAPEQITNKPKDQRTDIWQLGVILYELVTGRLPFTGESMVEIGMAIATKTPERPGPAHPDAEPLDAIILKCLEKDPEQRYQSVAGLQKDLAAYLKMNYIESLKGSIQANDLQRSAYYCGDLVLISMKTDDLAAAYKYAVDLARYSAGEIRTQAIELARQLKARVEMGAQELPDELIQKAEVIVHQIRMRG